MIVEYIKSLLGMVKKDEVLEDLRITMKDIELLAGIYSPNFKQWDTSVTGSSGTVNASIVLSKLKSDLYKKLSSDFYRYYKPIGVKKQSKLFPDIGTALAAILPNCNYIESQVEKHLEAAVIKEGITAKKAVLIRACDHLSFIAGYTRDLTDVLLEAEVDDIATAAGGPLHQGPIRTHMWGKYKNFKMEENIINYAKLLTIYTMSPDEFKQQLDDIPEVIINDKTSGSVVSVYGDKIDPFGTTLTKQFKGSPIYHYRLIVAEWQANRYRLMKEKKKMLELKVMQLQLLNEKNPDPKLDKEIEYMQNRIGKLEYSLHQMET